MTRNKTGGLALASVLLGGLALLAPAAEAHGRGSGHGHDGDRHPHHYRVQRHDVVYVPRVIAVEQRATYAPYYDRRVYVPAHHHYHTTYSFPVVVNGFVTYRPYTYCGGNLVVRASAAVPHLAFDIGFGPDPYGHIVFAP
jgi:hypothetical protein